MSMYYRCIAIFVGVFVSGFYAYGQELTIMDRVQTAGTIYEIETMYQNVKGDGYAKQNLLRGINKKKELDSTFTISKTLESNIIESINDKDAFAVKEALCAVGKFKIVAAKTITINRATNADKISPMYSDHIRQAAIVSLIEIGGNDLGPVFKNLFEQRRNYWFDGDLPIILQGLWLYGDTSAIVQIGILKQSLQDYLKNASNDDYRAPQCEALLSMANAVVARIKPQEKE